jgi:hypothetical protein
VLLVGNHQLQLVVQDPLLRHSQLLFDTSCFRLGVASSS